MDASNAPVRRPPSELHTGDMKIDQKPTIETREDLEDEIVVSPEVLQKEYAEAIKFMEDPVMVRVEHMGGENPPKTIEIWCNGKGAEVLLDGKWVSVGFLPVGIPVTTKRKYVEILARSKIDKVNTRVIKHQDDEDNLIDRMTMAYAPFSVIEDRNPKGSAWLTSLVRHL